MFAAAGVSSACGHGFGQRYDLPIPLSFYIWSAGATVALSFIVFAFFLRAEPGGIRWQRTWHVDGRIVVIAVATLRTLAPALLILVIAAGLFGNQDPVRNLAPVTIWVLAWVGLAFISLSIGDVWALINPWRTAFALTERAWQRLRGGELSLLRPLPAWVGVWPAFVLFVAFTWMELVWSGKNVPAQLAAALLTYSALTFLGMFLFGRERWLHHGEIFTLVFGLFARFAPLAPDPHGGITVRPPALGLLQNEPLRFSMVALVIAVLATVSFDGFLETPPWARVDFAVLDWASQSPLAFALDLREDDAIRLLRTLALGGCIVLFIAVYAAVCGLTARVAGDPRVDTGLVIRSFVLTVVPIALAYHVAHYFSLFFIGGQYAIPLLSDPLGRGWDLFGTARYQVDIGVVSPRLQWTVAVVAVVVGHVIAMYLAHVTALRVFRDARNARLSQLPMAGLMVGYTMLSLWILSQPIVETGR